MSFTHVNGTASDTTVGGGGITNFTIPAVGAGNLIVGSGVVAPNGPTVTSVTDNKGNAYAVLDTLQNAGDSRMYFSFIGGNLSGGPTTLTVTLSSGSNIAVFIDEYSGGLAAANPNDGHAAVQRNTPGTIANAITSTSIATAVDGDLIYSACWGNDVTAAPTAGTTPITFTRRLTDTTTFAGASEDGVQTTHGSINSAFTSTQGAGDDFGVLVVAVKPASTTVVEAEPHFIGQTYPLNWTPNKALFRTTAQDFSSFGVETNPHWRGRTWGMPWSPLRALMQNSDPNAPFTQPETNTHFVPRTLPVLWKPMPLARTTAQDFSSFGVETNPHWSGRIFPLQWNLKRDWAPPQDSSSFGVETNPHWTGRQWPVQWNLTLKLRQTDPQDSSSFGVETNPHWIGRPQPAQWFLSPALWSNRDPNAPVTVTPETNTFFTPRTFPLSWSVQRSLMQTTAQDFSSLGVETNVFFKPRTWPLQWQVQQSLMRGTAQDFSFIPPASQAVYARYGASHGIGALSAIPGEIPS